MHPSRWMEPDSLWKTRQGNSAAPSAGESNAEHVGPGGGTISARGNWTYYDDTLDRVVQLALYRSAELIGSLPVDLHLCWRGDAALVRSASGDPRERTRAPGVVPAPFHRYHARCRRDLPLEGAAINVSVW